MRKNPSKDILFDAITPLGFHVSVSRSYWQIIISVKHPIMSGHEKDVKSALEHPEEIRQSKTDKAIYKFLTMIFILLYLKLITTII